MMKNPFVMPTWEKARNLAGCAVLVAGVVVTTALVVGVGLGIVYKTVSWIIGK